MANGETREGWKLDTPEFRELFTRESVLASDWYAARLDAKQATDIAHQEAGIARLKEFAGVAQNSRVSDRLNLGARTADAQAELERMQDASYASSWLARSAGRRSSADGGRQDAVAGRTVAGSVLQAAMALPFEYLTSGGVLSLMNPRGPRVGIKDVARAAGVSVGTVSPCAEDRPELVSKSAACW